MNSGFKIVTVTAVIATISKKKMQNTSLISLIYLKLKTVLLIWHYTGIDVNNKSFFDSHENVLLISLHLTFGRNSAKGNSLRGVTA